MIQAQIVYVNAQEKPKMLPLPPHGAMIGRGSSCNIVTSDVQVSQQHAAVKLIKNAWHVEDQRSTNGTLVNGIRIDAPARLRHLDVISCGSLQLRFILIAGAEQRTLDDRGEIADGRPPGDLAALRAEVATLKKERTDLLEQLEQEDRQLAGANSENRQLRQAQDELRAQYSALRLEHERNRATQAATQAAAHASEREAVIERDLQRRRLTELMEQGRVLKAAAEAQEQRRRQAEQEAIRAQERLAALDTECKTLICRRDEALDMANQRQRELDDLRRTCSDWERDKAERDTEQRVNAARLKELLDATEQQEAALFTLQKELGHLRQRYEEKNVQHRGLHSELAQLNTDFGRYQAQAKLQSERLAKDNEALREQVQALRREAERI